MPDLLIELFSEEIPARMQARARDDLKKLITDGLVAAGLTYASAGAFSTPRRLVLAVEGLTALSPPRREDRKGPRTDAPAAAIEGFLRATGLAREQLEVREDKKAQVYFAVQEIPGRSASAIVAEVLETTIRNFPWPKSMRWGSGTLRWVRPLHAILCILSDEAGGQIVPLTLDGITAGNTTWGHRFLSPAAITVYNFDDYSTKLARAHVVLDSATRAASIWQATQNAAFAAGLEVVADAGLLAEVAGLVEWPVVLMGRIDAAFLELPPEVLQTSMRTHQKFFSLRNPKTGRIEGFVTVANTEAADHGATILAGNQKVLRARLSDAKFFWENDLRVAKAGMQEWLEGLKSVTYHNKLGSQHARIARIAALAREIAPLVGANPDLAEQAATLAKADLRSAMVAEFPELQGVMGTYYARAAGYPEAVALAARAHWQPLGPTDDVPTEPVSVAVALADKIDTLCGFWAIDEKPTGSKDPFALRRAALGVIRLICENRLKVRLLDLLKVGFADVEFDLRIADLRADNDHATADEYVRKGVKVVMSGKEITASQANLLTFFHDRLRVFLKDQGIRHDVIDACLAVPGNDDFTLLVKRAEAISAFLKTDDGAHPLQGFTRAQTILSQAEARDGVEYSYGADPKFAENDAERALFPVLDAAEATIAPAMQAEDYVAAMQAMAALRAPIDAFFDATQINADNPILRRNRLNLLHRIKNICQSVADVADLTKLEG